MKNIEEAFEKKWQKNYPKAVQLETCSVCNGKCNFCPYEETSKIFPRSQMSDELFGKIVAELKHIQPQLLAMYMNNEPLADKTFFDKLGKIRLALPAIYIDFSTNGSLLTKEKSHELVLDKYSLDEIKINFPSTIKEEYELITGLNYELGIINIKNFINLAKKSEFDGRYRIIMVGSTNPERDKLFWADLGIASKIYSKVSRGGIIETSYTAKKQVSGCRFNRQNEWMHILSSGEVVLCCMDWNKQNILGNLNSQTIFEIWNGKKYNSIRKRINNNNNPEFICNKCEWSI